MFVLSTDVIYCRLNYCHHCLPRTGKTCINQIYPCPTTGWNRVMNISTPKQHLSPSSHLLSESRSQMRIFQKYLVGNRIFSLNASWKRGIIAMVFIQSFIHHPPRHLSTQKTSNPHFRTGHFETTLKICRGMWRDTIIGRGLNLIDPIPLSSCDLATIRS